jgi:hypothetical protein
MLPFLAMAAVGAGTSVINGVLGAKAAKGQAAAMEAAQREAEAKFNAQADRAEGFVNTGADKAAEYIAPYAEGGQGALKLYLDAIGVNGTPAQQGFHDTFQNDPGFNASLDAGRRQVEHSSIFQGRGDSGATQKELFQFGQREQLGAFRDRLDRLSSLSGMGLQAGGQAASIENNRGTTLADIALKRGGVGRDTSLGLGVAKANGIGGEAQSYMDMVKGLGSSAQVAAGGKDAFSTLYGKPGTTNNFYGGAK